MSTRLQSIIAHGERRKKKAPAVEEPAPVPAPAVEEPAPVPAPAVEEPAPVPMSAPAVPAPIAEQQGGVMVVQTPWGAVEVRPTTESAYGDARASLVADVMAMANYAQMTGGRLTIV